MKNICLIILVTVIFSMMLQASDIRLERIKLPPGFRIEVYSDKVPNARAMAYGAGGTLFVGSMNEGKVYAVLPDKKVTVIREGLNMPVGVALYKGDLYVSAVNRIIRIKDALNDPQEQVITDALPSDTWHGWKFIRFGPDNKLYVPVGAPCNVCLKDNKMYASILRMNPDGSGLEVFAEGIRNTVGFDWDARTKELWFTENGADMMGDDIPPDELNRAQRKGMHFGFPFIHGNDIKDPSYYKKKPPALNTVLPEAQLGAHVAALGMRFYTGKMFPEKYKDAIFIAEHGSWNRSKKSGYRISAVKFEKGKLLYNEVFAEGWKTGEDAWGRPVDVEVLPDGSMLVSDDKAGAVYRIFYSGERTKR